MIKHAFILAAALCVAACRAPASHAAAEGDDYGVLVMAHGGGPEWNREVLDAVSSLAKEHRVEVAFGMADADTIQKGVADLEARGARRIGVVRLFVSGESWYERTEEILGVRGGDPPRSAEPAAACHESGDHAGHSMAYYRIETRSEFALSRPGLADVPAMGEVLAERAAALSRTPSKEDVLVLAHGPGDDAENERWLANLQARAEAVRTRLPFRRVAVMTLREDWPDKRAAAGERIRAYVRRAKDEGGTTIVIPFRVQGFGPYAEVLAGLDYVSDGRGLLPHPSVTAWVADQATRLRSAEFRGKATP